MKRQMLICLCISMLVVGKGVVIKMDVVRLGNEVIVFEIVFENVSKMTI